MHKAQAAIESIRDAGPNVTALVMLAGGWYVFRWAEGKLVYSQLREPPRLDEPETEFGDLA